MFDFSQGKTPSFTNTINLLWEQSEYNGEPKLRLVLEREGLQHPQWYSAGAFPDGMSITDNGKTLNPPENWGLSARCQAFWFLSGLVEACKDADITPDTTTLSSFDGMSVTLEDRLFEFRGNKKDLPFPVKVLSAGTPQQSAEDVIAELRASEAEEVPA